MGKSIVYYTGISNYIAVGNWALGLFNYFLLQMMYRHHLGNHVLVKHYIFAQCESVLCR